MVEIVETFGQELFVRGGGGAGWLVSCLVSFKYIRVDLS